ADRRLRERELRLDRGDPAPDRRPAPRPDEADGVPDQHRARPGGRRAGAGGGAARAPDRGRRARRLRARAARPREPALHARRRAPGPPRGLLDRRVLPQHRAERLPVDPRRRGGAAAPPHREPRGRGDAAPSAETPPPRGGTMRTNTVKRTLSQGGVAIGTMFFEFNTTGVARIAANAGADFALFDTEHTGWDADTIRTLMATARAAALVPMVRVPATQYHLIARPLDLGAMGIMIPMVESEEQARLFVRSAKYAPDGGRGAAFGVAHDDYEGGDVAAKMTSANAEVLL